METNDITLSAINKLCQELWAKRLDYDEAKKISSERYKELEEIESKVLAYLSNNELDSFKSSVCAVSVVNKFSVRVPTGEDLKEFITWYERVNGPGSALEILSVNSQRINAYYKVEQSNAVLRNDLDFKIPGISEPKIVQSLSIRKA